MITQCSGTEPQLERTTFSTSREMEFISTKELTRATGCGPERWPLFIIKELIDNALDACEEASVAPEITLKVDKQSISIQDNAVGISAETVARIIDYSTRTSSREAYVSPSRGAQGHALPCILAMPFALDGKTGRTDIASLGRRHKIAFGVDTVRQRPQVAVQSRRAKDVKNGTLVKLWWPQQACSLENKTDEILQLAAAFAVLNPHLTLEAQCFNCRRRFEATESHWRKWRPSDPTCAAWYSPEDFNRLVAGYIAHDQDRNGDRPVRQFIGEFRGLAGSAKQKRVLDATELARTNFSALANSDGLRHDVTARLLESMQTESKPVKPAALGIIGKEHVRRWCEGRGADMDTFEYRKIAGIDGDGLPFVVEGVFVWMPNGECRELVLGINFSAALENPFRTNLEDIFFKARVHDEFEPVMVMLHLATPRPRHVDRAKSGLALDEVKADAVKSVLQRVTKRWTKQRLAEEREDEREERRREALQSKRPAGLNIKEAAERVLPDAYAKTSGPDNLPVKTRQLYYAARGPILELTGRTKLGQQYFSQQIVREYLEEHPESTAKWDIVYDARGTFYEPHTDEAIAVGTLEIRNYLGRVMEHKVKSLDDFQLEAKFPTLGPRHRYSGLLFVEKEGFNELFRATQLAERFDLAYVSTKGLSVGACRLLADVLCGLFDIPLLVMRDFDKAGFSIIGTFRRDTRAYKFQNKIEVIDLGLRLEDVEEWGLESERVCYGRSKKTKKPIDPAPNLRENGATEEEIEFLRGEWTVSGFEGRRVELNAFTSPDLLAWLEGKLEKHGIKKVVPEEDTLDLASAYRRFLQVAYANERLPKLMRAAGRRAAKADLPAHLALDLDDRLAEHPEKPWDAVLAEMAREAAAKKGKNGGGD